MNHKTIFLFILLITLTGFANASLLANASVDKNTLSTNEIGILTIKIFNDSDKEEKDIILRAQTTDPIVFVESETKNNYTTAIPSLQGGSGKEIKIKIKATSTKNDSTPIHVYYGTTQPFSQATSTSIYTKELPVTVKATMEKKTLNDEDKITINFKLTNLSKDFLYKVSAETINPIGFEQTTSPIYVDTIKDGDSMEKRFEVIAPLNAVGTQKIIVAYGFFDTNAPHYFEQEFSINLARPNYNLILLIGAIVLIVAIYLYTKKGQNNKNTAVKGTEDKKK